MRKFLKLLILLVSILILVTLSIMFKNIIGNSEEILEETSNNTVQNEEELNILEENEENKTSKKYYLHESNLSIPSQEKCYIAQKQALSNLNNSNKKKIQESIRLIHTNFEYQLVDSVRLIKDPNSPYWEDFTTYGVFTDPYTGTKVDNGGRFLQILDNIGEIREIVKDDDTKNDLQKAYNILKDGMAEHKLSKCFEAHKIIHDYDYWVINTPVHLEYSPVDWGGTNTFFGETSIIK